MLDSLLLNVVYNGVLVLLGFTDNQAMDIVPEELEDVEVYTNRTISAIKAPSRRWFSLTFRNKKAEAVLISSDRERYTFSIRFGGHIITSLPVIK